MRELCLQLLHLPLQACNAGSVRGSALIASVRERGALPLQRRGALVAEGLDLLQLALQAGHAQGIRAAGLPGAPWQLHAGHYAPAAAGCQGDGAAAAAAGAAARCAAAHGPDGKARAPQGSGRGCRARVAGRGRGAAASRAALAAKVGELWGKKWAVFGHGVWVGGVG